MTITKRLYTGAAILALGTGMAQAQDLVFEKGEGAFSWDSLESFAAEHDYSGESIDITGPWTGRDAELVESVIAYFEDAAGASVNYSGSDSFEQDIVISTEANSAPNIAAFPQPGLLSDLAARGAITPQVSGSVPGAGVTRSRAARRAW